MRGSLRPKTRPRPQPTAGRGFCYVRRCTIDLPNLDVRLTATQAAAAVGVSKQVLNYWRSSGKLTPGPDGRYRYADILAAERATRRSGYSHRRQAA